MNNSSIWALSCYVTEEERRIWERARAGYTTFVWSAQGPANRIAAFQDAAEHYDKQKTFPKRTPTLIGLEAAR